ncbi:MAG: hypothetical protein AB199_00785 [Parcubacteria bacterium C7867-004]|nr:MAG: hypothetical protein AB199_00785 [Parcubacteria bacterium C7867-004]
MDTTILPPVYVRVLLEMGFRRQIDALGATEIRNSKKRNVISMGILEVLEDIRRGGPCERSKERLYAWGERDGRRLTIATRGEEAWVAWDRWIDLSSQGYHLEKYLPQPHKE